MKNMVLLEMTFTKLKDKKNCSVLKVADKNHKIKVGWCRLRLLSPSGECSDFNFEMTKYLDKVFHDYNF